MGIAANVLSAIINKYIILLITYYILTEIVHTSSSQGQSANISLVSCSSDDVFRCRDGNCVSSFDICDGERHCPDGSDEVHSVCLPMQTNGCHSKSAFQCAYGACIDIDKVCDGRSDCADQSDELLLPCQHFKWLNDDEKRRCNTHSFQCRNGDCIDMIYLCDGSKDCSDGSDETVTHCNAPAFRCSQKLFRCAYGACIDLFRKCNFELDCADGSDEDPYLCNRTHFVTTPTTTFVPPTSTTPATASSFVFVPTRSTTPATASSFVFVPTTSTTTVTQSVHAVTDTNKIKHSCRNLPQAPGTDYVTAARNVLAISCHENFGLPDKRQMILHCINRKWTPKNLKCIPLCPRMKSITAEYTYTYEDEEVDPESVLPVKPGTKSTAECAYGYQASKLDVFRYNECLITGKWRNPQYTCNIDCGVVTEAEINVPLIALGVKVAPNKYPWTVGIYLNNQGTFTHICGGSLILPHIVLTAAHCITKDRSHVQDKNKLRVTAGRYYRDWDRIEDGEERAEVNGLYPHPLYSGEDIYRNDIGLMELSKVLKFALAIKPICYNLPDEIIDDTFGFVTGWGRDEKDSATEKLNAASLPYMSRDKCLRQSGSTLEKYITQDKFCSMLPNGAYVSKGDSGGGVVFNIGKRFYVAGIVSTRLPNSISTFTDVSYFHEFLTSTINAILDKTNDFWW